MAQPSEPSFLRVDPRVGAASPDEPIARSSPDLLLHRAIPATLHDHRAAAPLFRPSADLIAALNVALAVGAPLLLTGEPGTGKTQLAYWACWYFRVEPDETREP